VAVYHPCLPRSPKVTAGRVSFRSPEGTGGLPVRSRSLRFPPHGRTRTASPGLTTRCTVNRGRPYFLNLAHFERLEPFLNLRAAPVA